VISDRDPVQAFGAPGGNQVFRAGNTIAGKKSMRMEIDIERHYGKTSFKREKLKASVSRV
jgi:hypothetical protein